MSPFLSPPAHCSVVPGSGSFVPEQLQNLAEEPFHPIPDPGLLDLAVAGHVQGPDLVIYDPTCDARRLERRTRGCQTPMGCQTPIVWRGEFSLPRITRRRGGVWVSLRQESSRKEEVTRTQKPFVATLRVNESRPAELGQQPEASLAWGGVTLTAKRRPRVPTPCYRAPKYSSREPPS
jgi:hypothetical protein